MKYCLTDVMWGLTRLLVDLCSVSNFQQFFWKQITTSSFGMKKID